MRGITRNGRIYARNSAVNAEIVALDVSLPTVALPPLSIAASKLGDAFLELSVQSTTGALLDASHANRIELIYSSDIHAAEANWITLDEPFTAIDQVLRTRVPLLAEQSRFIRAREKR